MLKYKKLEIVHNISSVLLDGIRNFKYSDFILWIAISNFVDCDSVIARRASMPEEKMLIGDRVVQGRTGASYLTIPKVYMRHFGVTPGTVMECTTEGDSLIYRPKREKEVHGEESNGEN